MNRSTCACARRSGDIGVLRASDFFSPMGFSVECQDDISDGPKVVPILTEDDIRWRHATRTDYDSQKDARVLRENSNRT
jgi:hypothetical protein